MNMNTCEENFIVEGFLVGADDRTIRLLMPPYVLDFDRAAVGEIDERAPLPTQDPSVGVAVRLRLRTGARLLGMSAAADIESRLWRTRRPFAMLTRAKTAPLTEDGAYAELERKFLAAYGIEI
jgi:hypothetical protein